jgi:serine/threonine-protein kinase
VRVILDPDDLLGRLLATYSLDRLIGNGAFAWVFAAHTPEAVDAAVKVLKPRYALDPQVAARFANEARMAGGLEHPNIVRIHGTGEAEGLTYLGMDRYDHSLTTLLESRGPLDEPTLIRIATDVAAGLQFAHGRGIVHRDVKLDNVLLDTGGRAVIGDFGIARLVSGAPPVTGARFTVGTPQYVSPEQARGLPLDGRSDVYSLGVTLYEAATGTLPFNSTDWFELAQMHVEKKPRPPRKLRRDLTKGFEQVILRCLAKRPDERYQSAAELREALIENR